ncbi:MAG: hypothetical protein COA84_04995 [Robiginitomaculum sp.]|nr:MAG: hypothetical protein COA84_04995 [Robiginitomaculum sp.]
MTKIRFATNKDAEIITNIQLSAWRHSFTHVPQEVLAGLSVEKRLARWKNLIRMGEIQLYVLDKKDTGVVGFCQIGTASDIDLSQYCGKLKKLYIHPDYQTQGFGSLLFEYGIKKLREQLYTKLVLWVAVENSLAISYYTRRGFQDDGARRIDTFTVDGSSATYRLKDWDGSHTLKLAEVLEARYYKQFDGM